MGPPSSEGTEAICRVPSGYFSQAPWYTLPDHLCRFRVRSIRWGYFLEPFQSPLNPIRGDNSHDPSHTTRPTNINVVPIDYPLRARLRGRLTLLRLALSRNPWSFGERVSHPLYRYSCQHSHFRYLHDPLPDRFTGLRNAPLPVSDQLSVIRNQKKKEVWSQRGPATCGRSRCIPWPRCEPRIARHSQDRPHNGTRAALRRSSPTP